MTKPNETGKPTRLIKCPGCGKNCVFDQTNEYRPFCSAVCKNCDIVAWATGGYAVPGPPAYPDDHDEREEDATND